MTVVVSALSSAYPAPRKAVIVLGFDVPAGSAGPAPALPYGALAERLPVADRQGIQQAVEEVLSAGLMELVFLTRDGAALAEEAGKPQQVMLSRRRGGGALGAALCGARALIGAEPFVVLAPERLAAAGRGVVARLLGAYRERGGNLAVIDDGDTLAREGSFAALARGTAGPYLLQPEVLDVLDGGGSLADALLALAEAWPLTALTARPGDNDALEKLAGAAE